MHTLGKVKFLCIIRNMHYEKAFWLRWGWDEAVLSRSKAYAVWEICIMSVCIMRKLTVILSLLLGLKLIG
jgi:hypothetical protein